MGLADHQGVVRKTEREGHEIDITYGAVHEDWRFYQKELHLNAPMNTRRRRDLL